MVALSVFLFLRFDSPSSSPSEPRAPCVCFQPPHLIVCISRLPYLSQSARSGHSIVLLFLIMTLLLLYDVDDMRMMSTRTEMLKDTDTKNYVRTYTLCWLSHTRMYMYEVKGSNTHRQLLDCMTCSSDLHSARGFRDCVHRVRFYRCRGSKE